MRKLLIDVRSRGKIDARETNGSVPYALVPNCMGKRTKENIMI